MPHMKDKVSLSELGKSWERIESTAYHTGRQPNKQTGDSQPFAHALIWVSPHFKETLPSDQALPLLQCILLLLSQPQGRQAAAVDFSQGPDLFALPIGTTAGEQNGK